MAFMLYLYYVSPTVPASPTPYMIITPPSPTPDPSILTKMNMTKLQNRLKWNHSDDTTVYHYDDISLLRQRVSPYSWYRNRLPCQSLFCKMTWKSVRSLPSFRASAQNEWLEGGEKKKERRQGKGLKKANGNTEGTDNSRNWRRMKNER